MLKPLASLLLAALLSFPAGAADYKLGDRLPAKTTANAATKPAFKNKLRTAWDAAPANESMNHAPIRIAGFLVPLEWGDKKLKEFLLVPYFGACIHSPPPPANQIIHVVANPPAKGVQAMEAVWVEGVLEIALADTDMGRSSYRMKASGVTRYKQ